jgi:hypothetical protein
VQPFKCPLQYQILWPAIFQRANEPDGKKITGVPSDNMIGGDKKCQFMGFLLYDST